MLSTLPKPTSPLTKPVGVVITGEVNVLLVRVCAVTKFTNFLKDVPSCVTNNPSDESTYISPLTGLDGAPPKLFKVINLSLKTTLLLAIVYYQTCPSLG